MDSSEPPADNIASTPVNTNARSKTTDVIAATAATASIPNSPQIQESPFFSYVNNLSPIEPVKAAHNVAQGFPGLNSPPLVFASPRINSLREANFLKRSASHIQQNSHDDIKGKNVANDQDISNKLISSPSRGLAADFHNESEIKNYPNTEPCNSPGCVDQYLADHVEVDCADSMLSADMDIKQSSDIQRPLLGNLTHLKDFISESEEGGEQVEGHLNISHRSQMKLLQPTHSVGSCRNKVEHKLVECLSNECPSIGSSLPLDFDSHVQQGEDSLIPNAESEDGEYHDNHLSISELSRHVQDYDGPEQNKDKTSFTSIANVMSDDSEACQKYRGLLRRCLQFEEATASASRSSSSLCATYNVIKLNLPAPVAETIIPQNSQVSQSSSLMKKQLIKLSQPKTSLVGPRCSGNTPFTGSKPSDIGLHLNSIVTSMPIGSDATANMRLTEDYMSVQGLNSKPRTNSHVLDNLKRCPIISHEDKTPDNEKHETNASNSVNLADIKSFRSKEYLSLPSSGEQPANTHDKRKLNQESAESSQEFNQSSSPKKKKKTASSNDSDGCKRCNCKKSKCLKLYCDCFAAGIYCSEPCACQGCRNRLEYEATVHEARQLIESRNPLAFVPKVVQSVPEFPTINGEDGNPMTPSSARHKRGCNCKKSMCLKKYCECYQSNVGCSLGCRCEGCKNLYGRKEDYNPIERRLSKEVMDSRILEERSCCLLNAELYDLQSLTPSTPAIQNSDPGKDVFKSRLLSGQYLTPTESEGKFTNFLNHAESVDVLQESSKEIIDADSFDWQTVVNNACLPTAISDFPSLDDASISSKRKDLSHVSEVQLSHGSDRLLSGSSFRWRNSPITPIVGLAETKYLEYSYSGSKLHDIQEDGTPEVLNDTSTPVKTLKASSPNQKRVSPPHNHARELGSSSSGCLRSCRKFILKAVPSFPPLTPHIDSKGMGNKNDASQDADGK